MNNKIIKALLSFVVVLTVLNVLLYFGVGSNLVNFGFDAASKVTNGITSSISSITTTFSDKTELAQQNQLYDEKINDLESQIQVLESQNDTLSTQLSNVVGYNVYSNITLVHGEVIMRNIANWEETITLNVGEKDGIEIGMPVISGGSFIGTIEDVNEYSSSVDLITSTNILINIPSYGLRGTSEKNGILKSYDSNTNTFDFKTLSQVDELEVGDNVYTNGYQDGVAKGLIIGQVVAVEDENIGKVYKVAPMVDIHNARYVEVITDVVE